MTAPTYTPKGVASQIGVPVPDNIKDLYGDGSDASIYYDGTNLVIDPAEVGTGKVDLNGEDLLCDQIGMAGLSTGGGVLIAADGVSGTGIVAGLNFVIDYSGVSNIAGNLQSKITYSGTATNPDTYGALLTARQGRADAGIDEIWGAQFNSTVEIGLASGFHFFYGADFRVLDNSGGASTGGIVGSYGAIFRSIPTIAGVSTQLKAGPYSLENIVLAVDKHINLEGAANLFSIGDTYITSRRSATGDVGVFIDGTECLTFDNDHVDLLQDMIVADTINFQFNTSTGTMIGTGTGEKMGFWGATPVAQPSAYTQTYSSVDKTHANPTSPTRTDSTGGTANTTVVAMPAVNGSGATTAQENAVNDNFADLTAQVNNLRADLIDLKQLVNSLIDDLQNIGMVG